MKKYLFALLLLAAAPLWAQSNQQVTVAYAFDLDGEAADADQVIEAVAIIDNGSVTGTDYTIAAQPDTCRLLDLTIVDTDLSAGTLTVTGTDCFGDALVAAFAFTAGDDTGVQTLTVSSGSASAAYFKTVTEVETGTMTGESDETFALGYSTNNTSTYIAYGIRKDDALGTKGVDPFSSYEVRRLVSTSGSSSTTLASVNSDAPFSAVEVGDLLILNIGGTIYERKVTARASANSVTLDTAVNIAATGIGFRFKEFFASPDPSDNLWFRVDAYDAIAFVVDQDAEAATGNTVTSVECETTSTQSQISSDTLDGAETALTSIDLRLASYDRCRVGLKFGTGDDADAVDEDINVAFIGQMIGGSR